MNALQFSNERTYFKSYARWSRWRIKVYSNGCRHQLFNNCSLVLSVLWYECSLVDGMRGETLARYAGQFVWVPRWSAAVCGPHPLPPSLPPHLPLRVRTVIYYGLDVRTTESVCLYFDKFCRLVFLQLLCESGDKKRSKAWETELLRNVGLQTYSPAHL